MMRSRGLAYLRIVALLLGLIAAAWAAPAQQPGAREHNFDVFAGYSRATATNEQGWQADVHWKSSVRFLGIEAGATGFGYGQNRPSAETFAYFGGPRLTLGMHRFRAFAHVAGGQAVSSGVAGPADALCWAVGGGIDFPVFSRLEWRAEGDYWSNSFAQLNASSSARYTTGPVFRF